MKITIEIQEELKSVASGIYMILFSNGFFYIGASKNIQVRIVAHIGAIKSDFKAAQTVKSLRKMSGFEGYVKFILIEEVTAPKCNFGIPQKILDREKFHKLPHVTNDFLLNRVETVR